VTSNELLIKWEELTLEEKEEIMRQVEERLSNRESRPTESNREMSER
jgi:predicted Fe-S protein YdhL (DUF1289 family)